MNRLVIAGAGGHGRSACDVAIKSGWLVEGFLDDTIEGQVWGIPVLGKTDYIDRLPEDLKLFLAVGDNHIRKQLAERFPRSDYAILIHPSAVIGLNSCIGEGSIVMAHGVVGAGAQIGRHVIVNTGSIAEHDCILEDYVHVSPNAALGGSVRVGMESHIGIGASILNNLWIAKGSTVGAGAVVTKNIEEAGVYIGVPARKK